ncbi:cystathionine gamma-synthase [Planctomycetales bacterium]|nr:cystathionine gamma-synthase [Planctomycetales bacterium]
MKFATLAVHAGQKPDPQTGAVNTPVYFTSTFAQDGINVLRNGFEYARTEHPGRRSLQTTLATLEGGKHALCFNSGQAASSSVLQMLEPGDEIVTSSDIYGGSYRLFHKIFSRYGIKITTVAETTPQALAAALSPDTAMVWGESPSNPLLSLLDIADLAERISPFRNKSGIKPLLVIDNTFPSPALQNPLALGADIVVHSCTKYIGGHSDVIGGAVIVDSDELREKVQFNLNAAGSGQSPMDCYLLQRGVRTLPLRMKKHEENAYAVADFLRGHKNVDKVFFPGFEDFPNHHIVVKQMKGLPGMLSFRLKGGIKEVEKFYAALNLIVLAESLGGVESLVCHPASMTHAAFSDEARRQAGITDNLIRVSLGIEDAADLIDDLRTAMNG